MGWTFTQNYLVGASTVELFKHFVLHDSTGNGEQVYVDVKAKGSTVFLLGKNIDDGTFRYWIDMFFTDRHTNKGEFGWKGMSALDNAKAGEIPKTWLKYIPDAEKQGYLKRCADAKLNDAGKIKAEFGKYYVCKLKDSYTVSYSDGFTIKGGEDFTVYVERFGKSKSTKHYRIACKNADGTWYVSNKQLRSDKTFNIVRIA